MENKKTITKSYLVELLKNPITIKEITDKISLDFNIENKGWRDSDTRILFKKANISLRSKPKKKKVELELIDDLKQE